MNNDDRSILYFEIIIAFTAVGVAHFGADIGYGGVLRCVAAPQGGRN